LDDSFLLLFPLALRLQLRLPLIKNRTLGACLTFDALHFTFLLVFYVVNHLLLQAFDVK